ncbi:MAG: hypothetical protein JXR79_05290 [Nitrospirae bacterium]|nr:hypothetical protein [Nitrospirota bacterium]
MKRLILLLSVLIFCFGLLGCGDNAAKLFDTAKFEELQNNKQHAVELYERILKEYPNSSYAERAKARLSELKDQR